MKQTRISQKVALMLALGLILLGACAYLFVPTLQMHSDRIVTWIRGWVNPTGELPTAESSPVIERMPQFTEAPAASGKPAAATEPLPGSVILPAPAFDAKKDYQDWNNCGPATLALALRYWGWQGDQFSISAAVRPERQDKNVNIEELAGYVNQSAAGLQAESRVGGDLFTLKKFIAAGFPVVIEESFKVEKPAWPGDDLWAGHYLLLTGYDDAQALFTVQDSYYGPDRLAAYDEIAQNWQSFNHLYLVVFPRERLQQVQTLFGVDWLPADNLNRSIAVLRNQLKLETGNAYAWFNLGSNLVTLKDYTAASSAFKTARQIGLPQRMLRYQFGPFLAATLTGDLNDLTQLLEYALRITPDSEEALYWKGQARLLAGDNQGAIIFFRKALDANPGFREAQTALENLKAK